MRRRRVSLKTHREEIGRWAAEGREDEWIAGVLGTSASSVQSFRSRNGIPHYKRRVWEEPESAAAMRSATRTYEGVVEAPARAGDAGEEGRAEDRIEGRVAVWFDPAVREDPVYRGRWMREGRVEVVVSGERMIVFRTGE